MAVLKSMHTILAGTVVAAVEGSVRFQTVPDNLAATICASRCENMDGTFETIEYMCLAVQMHFETLIILVAANLTHADVIVATE